MEVLRHGITYRSVECRKCCALISYCDTDITSIYTLDDSNSCYTQTYVEKYIVCPECGENIILSKERVY